MMTYSQIRHHIDENKGVLVEIAGIPEPIDGKIIKSITDHVVIVNCSGTYHIVSSVNLLLCQDKK